MVTSIRVSDKFKEVVKQNRLNNETIEETLKRLISYNPVSEKISNTYENPAFVIECFDLDKYGNQDPKSVKSLNVTWKKLSESKAGTIFSIPGEFTIKDSAEILFINENIALINFRRTNLKDEVAAFHFLNTK